MNAEPTETRQPHELPAPLSPHPPAMAPIQRVWLCIQDGLLLGLFMVSVGIFAPLIFSSSLPLHELIPGDLARGALMGLAMGATAITLIRSPIGGRTGAHMNPAVTLAYLRLGRISPGYAAGYIACQLFFGLLGVLLISLVMGPLFTDDPVRYAATLPGRFGIAAAFFTELAMTFVLMTTLLFVSNTKRLAPYTPIIAGLFVAVFITLAAPISGMSMNPARSLASAIPSGQYHAIWIYIVAPVLGMLAAAEACTRLPHTHRVYCCKLDHSRREICAHCGCDGPIDFDAHAADPSDRPSRTKPTRTPGDQRP